jgi:hypothetical protein
LFSSISGTPGSPLNFNSFFFSYSSFKAEWIYICYTALSLWFWDF